MTKIGKIAQQNLLNLIKQQQIKKEPVQNKISEESVISKLKPDVTDSNEAGAIAETIASKLQEAPESALSAQGNLDEARVLALLDDSE